MEGNQQKMREALDMVLRYLQWLYAQGCTDRDRLSDEIDRVVSAIGEPPRNCDVGTAEEQAERFYDHCLSFKGETTCDKCPLVDSKPFCEFAWAQMPYKAERKGEGDGK